MFIRPIAAVLAVSLAAGCATREAVPGAAAPDEREAVAEAGDISPLAVAGIVLVAGILVLTILVAQDDTVEFAY
jgi:hypothetical protein